MDCWKHLVIQLNRKKKKISLFLPSVDLNLYIGLVSEKLLLKLCFRCRSFSCFSIRDGSNLTLQTTHVRSYVLRPSSLLLAAVQKPTSEPLCSRGVRCTVSPHWLAAIYIQTCWEFLNAGFMRWRFESAWLSVSMRRPGSRNIVFCIYLFCTVLVKDGCYVNWSLCNRGEALRWNQVSL